MIVGSTVVLEARVAKRGTKAPYDPLLGVALTSLSVDGTPVTVGTTAFTEIAEGDFTLAIPTTGFSEGKYLAKVTSTDTSNSMVVSTVNFVLTNT